MNRKLKVVAEDGELPQSFVSVSMPSEFIIYTPPLHHPANTKPSSAAAAAARTDRNDHSTKPSNQGFESSMALTVFILLSALLFMGFFSVYLRCIASGRRSSRTHILSSSRSRRRSGSGSGSILVIDNPPNSSTSLSSSSVRPLKEFGLDPITVGSLPVMPYHSHGLKVDQAGGVGDECVVCLSEFEEEEMVKVIPFCGHLFHPDCIDLWFLSHSSCPLCRSTQLFPAASSSSDSKLGEEEEAAAVGCDDDHEGKSMEAVLGRTCSFSSSSSSNPRSGGGGGGGGERVVLVLQRSSSWPS